MTGHWHSLAEDEIDHELIWSLVGIVTAVAAVAMLKTIGLPPIACAFKSITGLPCLTCGATRALLALVHGAWRESLLLNPLVVPAVALGCLYAPYALTVSVFQRPRLRFELNAHDWRVARVVTAAGALGVWAYLITVGR
jgi:hypothetical protein